MSESLLHLYFLLLLLLSCVPPSSLFTIHNPVVGLVACGPHQIQALTQFKKEFDTRGCNHSDYSNRVWCDNSTGAVTKLHLTACLSGTLKSNSSLFSMHNLRYLHLSDNNLTSSLLPSEFGNLNRLEVLSLHSNGFNGPIPSSFNNLSMLSILNLSHNELTGSFPVVQNQTKLTVLDLSYNHLSGTPNSNNSLFELHHLRYLDLGYNNFYSSPLPPEFGNLNKLETLSLCYNGFFGQVPPTISNLTLLTNLNLGENYLFGDFPLVQNLTLLTSLQLSHNSFSGTIPSLFTMPFLTSLNLQGNHLKGSTEVPNSSTTYSLESLYLGRNNFDVKILESISRFTKLKRFDLSFLSKSYLIDLSVFSSLKFLSLLNLSGNRISSASLSSGSFPMNLEELFLTQCGIKQFPNILKTPHNLVSIEMSGNLISGKIPEWLWSLPRLSSVFMSVNSLSGFEGSAEVLVNSSLRMLDLGTNCLEGAIPHLPLTIKVFSVRNNSFRGEIPLSVCKRSSLVVLDLSYNNFTGPVPQCLSNLTIVNLRKNNLEGSIPDKFYADSPLRTLDVGYNRLTGKLPRSLLSCSSLKFLSVDNNKFEDTFPFWLKALPNLQVLILRSNKFYGPISPPHQGPLGFPQLRIFEISDNKLNGSLPLNYFVNWTASSLMRNEDRDIYMVYNINPYNNDFYTYKDVIDLRYKGLSMEQEQVLTSYVAIDFSGNRLEGNIPESIGLLKALIALNLSNNAFTGYIPSSLATNATNLESLDLSRNQLYGTIPNGLGSLCFLAYINVSHNQLEGEIPQGKQITGQSESSFEGNAGLSGLPLEKNCSGTSAPLAQQPKEEDEEEEQVLNWKAVAIGYGLGVFLGLAIAQVIALYNQSGSSR